jgi:hypothetical protein
LQLAFAAARVTRKNVKNELRAIDDSAVGRFFDIALLNGRQIAIENYERRFVGGGFRANFVQLAVAGSAASRTWYMVPATSAPALRASSTSSASDSRPCSPAGMPGIFRARFQVIPTSKARSRAVVTC